MDASSDGLRLQRTLVAANRILAIAYIGIAGVVAWRLMQGGANLFGGTVLILLIAALASGHFMYKRWALKASAAIFAFVNLLAIPYLFSAYEQYLLSPFQERLIQFILVTISTALLVANYYMCEKFTKAQR